jgi:hypothetical protein
MSVLPTDSFDSVLTAAGSMGGRNTGSKVYLQVENLGFFLGVGLGAVLLRRVPTGFRISQTMRNKFGPIPSVSSMCTTLPLFLPTTGPSNGISD